MNARTTAVLVGVAVIAAIALTAVRREHASTDAAAALARATTATGTTRADATLATQPAAGAVVPGVPTSHLVVAYRLDPSLTSSLYMGDRWVTPERYAFSQEGKRFVVQARLQAIDDVGSDPLDLRGTWASQDPDMVSVTPGADGIATIEVRKPGTTQLRATSGNESRTLRVTARQLPDAMDVAIVQSAR